MSKVVVTLEFGSLEEMNAELCKTHVTNVNLKVDKKGLGAELQEESDAKDAAAATAGDAPPPPPPTGDAPPPPPPGDPAPPKEPYKPPAIDDEQELDKDGIPWDERIHASTKNKVKAGTWKKKPKVDPAYYEQIKAELKAAVPTPEQPAAPPTTEQPAAPPPPEAPPEPDDTQTADAPITTFFELTGLFNAYGYDLEAQNKFIKENFDMPSIAAVAVKAKSDHDLVPGIADVVRAMPRPE